MRLQTTDGKTIARLEMADTLWTRTRGLLGRTGLAADRGLWITPCNSVHTVFMKFSIDLVFLDADLIVVKTIAGLAPTRLTRPVWRARSVMEFAAGFVATHSIQPGTRLHVDHSLS